MPLDNKGKYFFDPKNPDVYFDPKDPNSRSVTNQSDKDTTDINLQFARYEKTGLIPDLLTGEGRKPMYGDFTGLGDFHQLQTKIARANQAFMALPASVRSRFQNDPAQLVDFLADPNNDEEAVKLELKPFDVLKTALADDGVTKITKGQREDLDRDNAKKAAEAAKTPAPGTGAGQAA